MGSTNSNPLNNEKINQSDSYKDLVDELLSKSMQETFSRSPERSVSFDNEREAFRKFLEEAPSDDEEDPNRNEVLDLARISTDATGVEGESSSLESDDSSFGGNQDFNSLSD